MSEPDPTKYAPTGVNVTTGAPAWRAFTSKEHWINKAPTWMQPGDVCIDSTGRELRIGADFDGAAYPVYIARPLDVATTLASLRVVLVAGTSRWRARPAPRSGHLPWARSSRCGSACDPRSENNDEHDRSSEGRGRQGARLAGGAEVVMSADHFARGRWDSLGGAIHRLRLGPYVLALHWTQGAWTLRSDDLGLEARSTDAREIARRDGGATGLVALQVDEAKAWVLRRVGEHLRDRAAWDEQAERDIERAAGMLLASMSRASNPSGDRS